MRCRCATGNMKKMGPREGLEPPTLGFVGRCSESTELTGQRNWRFMSGKESTSVVSIRERQARPAGSARCTRGREPLHISAERDRAGAGGTGWAQPKWGGRAHRCAVHRFFVSCGAGGRPEPAPPRGKLLRIGSLRCRDGAARWPQEKQNKKARILSESGPLGKRVGRCAYALPPPGCRLSSLSRPASPACMAHTNAYRPVRGRWFGVAMRVFTMGPCTFRLNESLNGGHPLSDDEERTVKSLY
jgi:hypothetical protein